MTGVTIVIKIMKGLKIVKSENDHIWNIWVLRMGESNSKEFELGNIQDKIVRNYESAVYLPRIVPVLRIPSWATSMLVTDVGDEMCW